jgi:hypothetical protein
MELSRQAASECRGGVGRVRQCCHCSRISSSTKNAVTTKLMFVVVVALSARHCSSSPPQNQEVKQGTCSSPQDSADQKCVISHGVDESSTTATQQNQNECGLYLAPSSIPGAGWGMYAGSEGYQMGAFLADPDLMVPVYELDFYHPDSQNYWFLWDEYTWRCVTAVWDWVFCAFALLLWVRGSGPSWKTDGVFFRIAVFANVAAGSANGNN